MAPDAANDADVAARPDPATPARHLLCAYSPRWLSGPVPAWRGLCATWSTAEVEHDRTPVAG
ncbi:MAG: hypothetical protein R2726_20960 [Acidimicrobiales bacterium]